MKTILLGLNELNLEYIKYYSNKGLLPNFKKLFDDFELVETDSENKYELLEPWIQWATIHTGKTYDEHNIFRLGDIVNSSETQIFEYLESKGLSVGAVSPFNAKNNLTRPKFFIPDPWTKTKVSGNWLVKSIYQAIHQSVNDNASGRLGFKTIFSLLLGLIITTPIRQYFWYLKMLKNRKNPGVKAIVLDSLLANTFFWLLKFKKPDFSNLFLNVGAHIQHHYLFNSQAYDGNLENPDWYCPKDHDPLILILSLYDKIIGKLLDSSLRLVVATGLHQQPHRHLTFYWRINKHEDFIKRIGIDDYEEILPRMSRDFLINFKNSDSALKAEKLLNSFFLERDNEKVFKIDNRGNSLFIELIYPNEIFDNDVLISSEFKSKVKNFKSLISFVAIKNGEHNGIGYFLYSKKDYKKQLNSKIQLKQVRNIIEDIALVQR